MAYQQVHFFFIISNWGQALTLKVPYFFKIFRAKSCVAVAYKFKTQLLEKSKRGIHRSSWIS